jgi:hypothetical protein
MKIFGKWKFGVIPELISGIRLALETQLRGKDLDDPTAAEDGKGIVWDETQNKFIYGSGSIYDLASPATITVGGVPSGYVLTGKSTSEILEKMLVVYQAPTFSAFSITGQSTTIEVGVALSGSKTFTWATTNNGNITPNTLSIKDVDANNVLASGLSNDGTESITIGTITNTSPIIQDWEIRGTNTQAADFTRTFTVSSIYPYFWGKVASGGAASGVNRPASNQALINSGTKVVASSTGTITIDFNSTSDDYIWFAIPSTSTSKTKWYISALNNGNIGGGSDLFPSATVLSIDSPTVLWNGVSYKIYISNYQTAATDPMELRNS